MKYLVKHGIRFALWWTLAFVVIHSMMIIAVSSYLVSLKPQDSYLLVTTLLIPVIVWVFARWFFRKLDQLSEPEIVEIAIGWGVLFALASASIGPLLYGIPWTMEFTNLASVFVDIGVVLFVWFAGFLRLRALRASRSVDVNLLSSLQTKTESADAVSFSLDSTVETDKP